MMLPQRGWGDSVGISAGAGGGAGPRGEGSDNPNPARKLGFAGCRSSDLEALPAR